MNAKMVGLCVCIMLATTVVAPSSGATGNQSKPVVQTKESQTSPVLTDWWPMFGHDLSHSHYSSSPAPDTNNTLWSSTIGGNYVISSPAVADKKVYVGSCNKVNCLNASNGIHIWNYTTGGPVDSSPTVADGKVYVGSGDHKLYCLDALTGAKAWDYTTGDEERSSPAVVDGKVYIGSWDHKVYCLYASNGTKVWNYTTGAVVASSPSVADGKVYIGSADGKVYSLYASNGTKVWDYTTGGAVASSPSVADGKVYLISTDGKVYCLNAAIGAKIWDYVIGGYVESSPAVANGKVYAGYGDLYCLDAATGGLVWESTNVSGFSSPAVADGKVYIGSGNGKMYCLNAETGTKVWDYITGLDDVYSSPAIAEGNVYVGSNGTLYCFGSTYTPQPLPILDLINIKGGLLGLSVMLRNVGEGTADQVSWSMNATANLFFPKWRNGTIGVLVPGQSATLQVQPAVGLGKASVTFTCFYKIQNMSYDVTFKVKQEWRDQAFIIIDSFPTKIQPTKEWVHLENYSYVNRSGEPGVEFHQGVICNMHNVRVVLETPSRSSTIWLLAACKFTNGTATLHECWITKDLLMGGHAHWELELVDGG